ncbi:ferritin light chain-like [Eublepharis macularius]|uniref:Ferritin n=1 Tax=Eublepharis macularius TaxID=481883 RepID=A0AA97IXB2_EUBMA|nr:ferritin light chain-like [Eublepharis macularius]
MAEPSPKRLKSGLPLCTIHRPGNKLVKQNFPLVVEEALCGVTSALLEVSYVFQLLGEIFDLSDMGLPNVSKFFWEQAKEERNAAEILIQYQHDRGGLYCTKVIQKPPNVYINGVTAALEVALVQWKMLTGYFEDLYALSIKTSDPHTASTIKKRFLAPKIQKIKLMGDLITNAHRLRSAQDGRGDLENYLIDRLQKELRIVPDLKAYYSPSMPLEKCAGIAKGMQLLPEELQQPNNNIKPKYSGLHCSPLSRGGKI